MYYYEDQYLDIELTKIELINRLQSMNSNFSKIKDISCLNNDNLTNFIKATNKQCLYLLENINTLILEGYAEYKYNSLRDAINKFNICCENFLLKTKIYNTSTSNKKKLSINYINLKNQVYKEFNRLNNKEICIEF